MELQDGETLLGYVPISDEISRVIGKKVTESQAAHWAKRGVYRVRKAGHFVLATKTSIAEDFSLES
jgi:hypothetical protein